MSCMAFQKETQASRDGSRTHREVIRTSPVTAAMRYYLDRQHEREWR
jgi:hypothetical protein